MKKNSLRNLPTDKNKNTSREKKIESRGSGSKLISLRPEIHARIIGGKLGGGKWRLDN